MNTETIFRSLFILSFLFMLGIRVYYQHKVLHGGNKLQIRENAVSLAAGSIAALTTIVFGVEYIFFPGTFSFAYSLTYPLWLRWLGAVILTVGISILWMAHHHLGLNFHSLVGSKEEQSLVQSGPYRWIRHPIYTAYILDYIGGGLLAGNLVLTVVPVVMFTIMIAMRMGREEAVMREKFGEAYDAYTQHTGRLLPRAGTVNLLDEITYDLQFLGSHTLQPKWFKVLKIFILLGFLAGYYFLFGGRAMLIFLAAFLFLMLVVHFVYRNQTRKYTVSWMDFVVATGDEDKPPRIGKYYYPLIILNAILAFLLSQFLA